MRQQSTLAVFVFAALTASGAFADAPSVTLTYPVANTTFSTNLTPAILLQASAADPDEPILAVSFYICPSNGTSCTSPAELAGTATVAPYRVLWTPPHIATQVSVATIYFVSAQAQNALGQARGTSQVAFTVIQPPDSPSIYLIAPTSGGGRFVTPAAPVFYATAFPGSTLPPSSVAYVDFLDGDTVIGRVAGPNSDPVGHGYAFVWSNPPLGVHLISARVTDTLGYSAVAGNSITGVPIQLPVSIVDPAPLQVGLSSPTTGQIFTPAGSVPLTATVTGAQDAVQRVDFVAGTVIVGTAFRPPYSATWTNPPAGDFMLVARAVADGGVLVTSLAAHIKVLTASRQPSAVLTAPAPGATIAAGAPLMFAADALAPDGSIGRVEFFAGTTLVGSAATAPYQFSWANPTGGALSLIAKAYDLQGHVGMSAPVSVTVTSGPVPVVALTAPAAGATFTAPATIGLSAAASEVGGSIARVEFFANGSLVGTAANAPYNFTWGGVAAGNYTLTAKATDAHSATATSAAVAITVLTAPSATLIAPAAGTKFTPGQSISMTAQVSTPGRTIARVDFLADGLVVSAVPPIGSPSSATVSGTWTAGSPGAHTLSARVVATDAATGVSPGVAVTIVDLAVNLVEPFAAQVYLAPGDIRISARPGETGGTIVRVDFYGDGVFLGTRSAPPYTWLWPALAAGSHTVLATVLDATALSSSVTVPISVLASPTLQVDPGIDGATVADDVLLVSGAVQAPPNSAVMVNGLVAAMDRSGRFFANGVPLADGANVITCSLSTQGGATATKTVNVMRTGSALFQVSLDRQQGMAPMTARFYVTNRGQVSFQRLELDADGDGLPDVTVLPDQFTNGNVVLNATYTGAGTMRASVKVFGTGNVLLFSSLQVLVIRSGEEMDTLLQGVYAGMLDRLRAGNASSALDAITGGMRDAYSQIFDALGASLPTIVDQLGTIQNGAIGDDVAEYMIVRNSSLGPQSFPIYLIRCEDGVWRIDGM
jgi:hypothetical protein